MQNHSSTRGQHRGTSRTYNEGDLGLPHIHWVSKEYCDPNSVKKELNECKFGRLGKIKPKDPRAISVILHVKLAESLHLSISDPFS